MNVYNESKQSHQASRRAGS